MFWVIITGVFLTFFSVASSQNCEKNSYLPRGLACKLDIFIRSEGQSDKNLTAPSGSSYLIVNGHDYSRKSRGINVAVFDQSSGRYMSGGVFDVNSNSAKATELRDFLQTLPNQVIIVMAIQQSGNANSNLNDAVSAMNDIGVNNTAILDKESFAAVLYKGPGSQTWVRESKNTVGNGPSFVSVSIPVPYGYIPEESLRAPFFNVAGLKYGGKCLNSSTNSDANTICTKALDGSSVSEWVTKTEGIGAWISIGFASSYKINKVRLLQRTLSSAQSKDVRIDFSDCSTFAVSLTRDKGEFEEFTFSPRIASWVKLTVTSTHTSASNGFKEIEFYYDHYESDLACDQVDISSASTSKGYRLLESSIVLQIMSQKPVVILSTTTSPTGPRYEVILDDTNSTTYIMRSHDGSAVKKVAVSVARIRVMSDSSFIHVWLAWKAGRIAVGMGEDMILFYRDEQPLTVKYMFLRSPTSNAKFKLCGRKDYFYSSASYYWPLDKLSGGSLINLHGFKRVTFNGLHETTTSQGKTEGFQFIATLFDGTSTWLDLGDFKDTCVSDTDLCHDGLTVMLKFNRQGSGERYLISSGGQHTRGFAIYFPNSTTVRVEVRDSERRWLIEKSYAALGYLQLGFTWSRDLGLTVVFITSSISVERNCLGEMTISPADESNHLILGRPNNENAKYFQGSINDLVIFERIMTSESVTALLKGTGMSSFTDSCYKDSSASSNFLYYTGDINPEVLSPSVCRESCGKAYFTKAVLYKGSSCTCVNSTSSFVPVANDLCTVPCTGNAERKCGGEGSSVSVLNTITSTASIVCNNIPTTQEALTPFTATVQVHKPFYEPEKFCLEIGDGSQNEKHSSTFKHAFVVVENFTTNAKAVLKNNETGQRLIIECPNSVESFLPAKGFLFSCPQYVPTNSPFKCNTSFTQGSDVDIQVTWYSGSTSNTLPLPDSMLVSFGPEYMAQLPPANLTTPGMYILPHVGHHSQKTLVGFQLDVVNEGYLEIKCLNVLCEDSSQRFCPSQKACIGYNTICEPEIINCTSGSTLSMSSESCLRDSGGPSSSIHQPTVSSSNVNYKSKTNLIVWVNSGERNLIPLNNTVDVSECDFFAVSISSSPSAAVIATSYAYQSALFYPLSAINAANTNNGTFVGLHSPPQANGPQVKDTIPNVQLKFIARRIVTASYTYTSEGTYEAKAVFSGGQRDTNLIHVQDIISNVSFSSVPAAHPTLKASNVSLIPHAGTNVTYTLIFNDTNITTSTPWTMYTCKISGVHSIAVFARNKVSVSYTVCSMECQDEISGLEFTQHGLPTSAERESTRISWSLKNGSKIYFSINTGDESGVRLLNDSKVSGAIFVGTLNTTYSKAGVYTVNITACNKLGCESIQGSITIQEKVANVTMNAPYCMATNKSVNITANTQHGDMLNYAWTINNMTFKTNGQPYLIYTPSKAGIYNATVVVYNNVSTGLYSCKYIQVKDTVGGIEVGPVKPSGVGQPSCIPYKVNEGSDLRISICYGDGVCTDKNGTDKNGTFTHNYTRHGDYIANLTVCNCVGCNSSQIDVHVETPVIGSKVVVSKGAAANVQDNACSAPFYIKVNQTLFMVLTLVNGTNVKNIWDYGDGFNSSQSSLGDFNKNGMRSNHSYSKAGNYTLTAKPSNLNGHEVFKCHIVAQDPFTGLAVTSNSPQGIPNGLVNITVTPTMPRPSSPIHCVFAYGDKDTSVALPMSYNTQRLTTKHYYPFKGKFYGSVNCSNAIDCWKVTFIVELQDKIKGSNIKAYGTHPQKKSSHVIGEGYNGRGTQGSIFGQNRDIQFLTKTVNGSNLTCSFCFDCNGTEKVFKNSSCDNITHKFMTIGEKEVKVEVKNDVSSEIANVYVTIDDIIDCGKLTNDGPNAKGYPHIFTASPKNVGPNWCCSISYGDSSKPDYFVSNTSNCSNEFTLGFSGNVFHGNHTYNIVKEYNPEMECWNRVSQCKVQSKAVLSQIRCEQPKVSIIDLSPNLTSVTKIKRSVSFDIRTKNIIDCDSLQRSFKWNVYNASDKSNNIPINMTSLAVTNKESFHSPPRTFKNGLYRLCFTLNMTEVAGIAATTCSPLRIIPSDLIADIVGGTEIAVGFNKTKVLDASNSRDPDTEHKASNDEKLRCYWFCKRDGDNYNLSKSINRSHLPIVPKKRELQGNDSNNPDLGGCFGDGPGRLNTSSCNDFKVFTGEMLENTTYDIRLFVMHDDGRTAYKDQRWKIKQGDPPSMAIECHFNCKEKLNPSSKVSLSCYCTSCTSVNYQWEVEKKEEKNPGESKYVKLSTEELEAILTTPANTRSFSIMPNSLMDDAEYRFICKGRRGEKGTEGYAYYQKKANSKPRNGICDVTPRTGVALNTTFTITCSGWEDVDKPLIYTYASAQDCESKKFTILASDRITSKYKVESMPPGRADKNYTTSVRVFVSDVLKAIDTSTCVTIQVREQKLDVAELGKLLNGTVENLLASGSSSEVNQVVSSILSQVNQDSSSSSVNSGAGEGDGAATPPPTKSPAELEKEKQENTKIRGKIIGILGKVADTATNLNEVTQSSATLTNTINKPDELTDDAKKEAVSIIGKLTKAIESKSENAEPQEVEQAVQAVYAGISNCVDFVAASSPAQSKVASPTAGGTTDANNGYQQPQQKTISPEEKDAKRKLQDSITKTIESIAALLQKAKQPGEKPTTMKTKTMEMQISRERSKDLKNKSISVTGLSLTTNPQMFEGESEDNGGGKEPPAIDSTIVSSKKNIFSYDESAYLVEGGIVATIEFKNSSSRDSYIIQDLSTQFEMFVDRHSTQQHPVTVQLTTENLAFHQMNVTVNDTAIHLNVYPDSCDYGFEVFIKKGSFPSETNYDYNYTLPHDGQWDFDSNCSISSNRSSAFEIFMSNKYLNYTAAGLYFIGIRFKARKTEMFDILPVNYTVVMYTSSCMYWDEKKETWRADGCVVGPKSNPKKVQCLCNHMTSFSSSFITPPNKIDWNRIKNPDFSRASVCITTVFVVLAIYIICLIPARKADRRDAEKVGVSPLPDNDPRDTYCYEIHVHTGFMRGAGTSAEISVVLNGSVGESDPRVLKDPARKNFRTGGVDAFLMTAPQSLGSIKNVRIWHNNEGSYPSWNLLRIMIQDLQTEQRWWFVCDKWLAVDEGDGKIERILYPATSNELTKFNVLFATEVRKNLTDGHLWFSVVTRPARSTFTRVQRLTCCLSILYCTMLANIMFYRADQSQGPKGSIQIAGYSFSLAQISTGIISSLIVFPSNLIVVQIFRKARAKDTNMNISSSYATTLDEIDVEKAKEKEKPKKEGLPHWCVYLAYALALVTSLTSAVFVIFYGFTFGAEKSAQWLMSMTVSFIQDVLISQPIKVFLVASIFALLIKDPNKAESDPLTDANKLSTDEEWLHKNVKDLNNDEKENFKKLITDRPPDEAKLEIARQLRMKEKHMKSIIQELVWYMFFLLIILTISYGNRDPATFRITKYMNDIFLHSRYSGNLTFNKVKTINNYWKWLNETVVPSIYKDKWYNDHQSYPLGFLADTPTDFVLAVARLRQLRIKKNSCPYLPVFKQVIAECNDFYSPEDEDRRDLLPGWRIPSTNTSLSSKTAARKTAWEYQTGEELNTYPYWGYKATYDAGGYVEELPTNRKVKDNKTHAKVNDLHNLNWLDRYTRAIFTELSIYNANTNFFCVITLLFEQLPTGGLFNYPSILTLKLYRYVGGDMYFVLSCEIVYLLFTLYFIFRELKMVKKEGIGHFKNPWSMVEVFVTMLSFSLVVLYFVRMKFTAKAVGAMRKDHTKFISFHYTAFLDEWINALMGLVVFLSFLKVIRLLRFNRRMSLLAQTLKVCLPRIFAFLIIYGVAFFAYSQFACLVFGQSMEGFGTILRSSATLMDTILGKFALKELTDANRLIGPIFFYLYTVTMVFILINMFLSIINDSFAEVKNDVNKQPNEYEIVNFMVHRLKENIGKTMGNAIMPIYKEPKSKLEKDFDCIEEHADNIMHYMRNMTFENMRHTRWFDAETSKEKKKKMFEILMEVDWDYFEDELGDAIPVFEEFLNKYDEEKLEDVHQAYRYKKMREQEMESKFTTRESDQEEESSDDSDEEDPSDQSDTNNDDNPGDEYDLIEAPKYGTARQSIIPSPAHSIRSIYSPSSSKTPLLLNSPKPLKSHPVTPDMGKAKYLAPHGPQASESELSDILHDIERKRCATDAELNSFLPEVKTLDDNNVPKYDSDPEQVTTKSKKKKKPKKLTSMKSSTVSIKSKAAWTESEEKSRHSPAGSSDRERILPDGAEKDSLNNFGQDNQGFEKEVLSGKKEKKKKKKEQKSTIDNIDWESMS